MKCQIPEISWHNRDPVLSVDFQPKFDNFDRLASGGSDSHVLIWYISLDDGAIRLDLASDLTRHQRAVNCVRWSPSGEYLASCDDESVIIVWKKKPESDGGGGGNLFDDGSDNDKETWLSYKTLRGHLEDIYDLSFSSDSNFLISGSVDNTAIVWDVHKAKSTAILRDHKGFVQGVAWDPLNKYLATLSTDRHFRIFDAKTKKIIQRNSKSLIPVAEGNPFYKKPIRLFHDDTLQTFFRRLSFSPDGSLIVVPSGIVEIDGCSSSKPFNTTYIYTRYSLDEPALVLPSPDSFTVAVRFCPLLFELRESKAKPSIPLPYRMIFAIATKCSVYLYDSQQKIPFGLISNIHYTRLTDLTWSYDGKFLLVSSTDGYCSIVHFADGELGTVYKEKGVQEILNSKAEKELEPKKRKKKPTKKSPTNLITEDKPAVVVEEKENEKMEIEGETDIALDNLPESIKEMIPVNKIIKTSELFSPEKKPSGTPATPIQIRKCPRVPEELRENNESNVKTPAKEAVNTPKASLSKTPNRIEVRRFPRSSIQTTPTTPIRSMTAAKNENDDWPKPIVSNDSVVIERKMPEQSTEIASAPKTPRRIELQTPKSKKKLL